MSKKCIDFNLQGILLLCLLIASGLILQGCFGSQKHRSGKLSDAMEKSSDEHEGEREVDTQPNPEEEDDEGEFVIGVDSEPAEYVATDSSAVNLSEIQSVDFIEGRKGNWFTIAGGTGLLREENFYGLYHLNLAIGAFFAERHYIELLVGIDSAPVQESSLLSESLDDGVVLLHLDLGYKYYTTSKHTFMGLYLCGGLGYVYMIWSYKNPFEAIAYDEYGDELGLEMISSDGMSGFELYAGLGLNIIQTEAFQLGGEILPGLILWSGETSEGFDNDVFDNFYYIKLSVFIRFGW
jgi:hypothetical protein